MLKTALIFGGTYALGSLAGAKVADVAGFKTDAAVTGTKIATGVAAFFILSALLR